MKKIIVLGLLLLGYCSRLHAQQNFSDIVKDIALKEADADFRSDFAKADDSFVIADCTWRLGYDNHDGTAKAERWCSRDLTIRLGFLRKHGYTVKILNAKYDSPVFEILNAHGNKTDMAHLNLSVEVDETRSQLVKENYEIRDCTWKLKGRTDVYMENGMGVNRYNVPYIGQDCPSISIKAGLLNKYGYKVEVPDGEFDSKVYRIVGPDGKSASVADTIKQNISNQISATAGSF